MKKTMLSLLALVLVTASFGQNEYKKAPGFAIHLSFTDFQTATEIRNNGLSAVLRDNKFYQTKRMTAGLAMSYIQGLSDHVDFAGTLTGSFLDYPIPNRISDGSRQLLLEAAATANLKLTTDRFWFVPFLTAGVGASQFQGHYGAFIPAGVGIQIKLASDAFILLNSQYRIPVTDNTAYHFYHSMGIAKTFNKPKVVVPVEVPTPVILDRDGDGIADADDKCPDTPGLASLQGCPDRDGDGIADGDDKCPDVAGLAKYQGCPIPDTDGDGINDEMDKCPTVKGFARYQGCPIPDTDGDGVNDEEDKCPSRPGPASNQGCPEIAKEVIEKINFAAKNVFFATGSYKLLAKSNKSLDEVVRLMKEDESLMLDIDGHTDAQGTNESNQVLSDNRAGAVKQYLTSKGIDASRLKSTGYGEEKPVADNKTAAGRAKNRRTEMTVRNY
ncbi:MAG: OmpA family protein [Ferruginibacter sp.]|nr:OmpA family protein [Ferruginibacter sp.]